MSYQLAILKLSLDVLDLCPSSEAEIVDSLSALQDMTGRSLGYQFHQSAYPPRLAHDLASLREALAEGFDAWEHLSLSPTLRDSLEQVAKLRVAQPA